MELSPVLVILCAYSCFRLIVFFCLCVCVCVCFLFFSVLFFIFLRFFLSLFLVFFPLHLFPYRKSDFNSEDRGSCALKDILNFGFICSLDEVKNSCRSKLNPSERVLVILGEGPFWQSALFQVFFLLARARQF